MRTVRALFYRAILGGKCLIYSAKLLVFGLRPDKSKQVLFNIKNGAGSKYFASLIIFFLEQGYSVKIRPNVRFVASLLPYKNWLTRFGGISASLFASAKMFVTDKEQRGPYAKIFKTSFRYFSDIDGVVVPYPMSPFNYSQNYEVNLKFLRTTKRSIGAYFSGNQDPEVYDSPVINERFKKVSRVKMIRYLKNHISDIVVDTPNVDNRGDCLKKLVLAEWTWNPKEFVNSLARTRDDEWLPQLARCNFFLALPGMVMPMCHNIIEAMAVGTIPILEYPEEFFPPLEHEINGIVYSGEQDCVDKIYFALSLSDEKVAAMRSAVIDYYEKYLSPRSFVSKIENLQPGGYTLIMNAEQLSVYER